MHGKKFAIKYIKNTEVIMLGKMLNEYIKNISVILRGNKPT